MKKSKKLLALLAALTVGVSCFAFTACGDGDGDKDSESGNAEISDGTGSTDGTGDTGNGSSDGTGGTDDKDTDSGGSGGSDSTGSTDATGDTENGSSDEETNKIVLTENTDFAALVSEKVDEGGWKTAFGVLQNVTRSIDSSFGVEQYYNSTLKHVTYTFDGEIESCIRLLSMTEREDKYIGFFVSVGAVKSIDEADQSIYFAKYADTGNIEIYNEIRDEVKNEFTGEFEKITTGTDDENYERMNATLALYDYKLLTPDCSEYFSMFTYNDEINAYEFKDGILRTGYSTEDSDFDYTHIVVKIVNGRLSYLLAEISGRLSYINYYYDFGTTEVTLPLDKIKN